MILINAILNDELVGMPWRSQRIKNRKVMLLMPMRLFQINWVHVRNRGTSTTRYWEIAFKAAGTLYDVTIDTIPNTGQNSEENCVRRSKEGNRHCR